MTDPTPAQVRSACLSYRHDYGLLGEDERKTLQFEAREWLHAWCKEGFAQPYLAQCEGQAPVAWLVPSDETGFCRIWWRDKESADAWIAKHPHCTLVPLYATPTQGQPAAVADELIERLQSCVDGLEEANPHPKPYDFYYAVKNEGQGSGWRYECVGIGINDVKEALAALTRSVEATDATINNPLSDSRVGVEAGEPKLSGLDEEMILMGFHNAPSAPGVGK